MLEAMKVVTLLPSATEIVTFVGGEDSLVGITHECDWPPSVQDRPRLTQSSLPPIEGGSRAIDHAVSSALHAGSGIYALDRDLLEQLDPDLVITQELCEVCAVSYDEVQQAVRQRLGDRRILSLEPMSVEDILGTIELVARELGTLDQADEQLRRLRFRLKVVQRAVRRKSRPRTWVMEWLDPPFAAGHWIPEMVSLAGGEPVLGTAGQKSVRIEWDAALAAAPEVIILAPCGFGVEQAIAEYLALEFPDGWDAIPAVRDGRVYAVDANAYVSRPGPRVIDGIEIFASALHPDLGFRYMADEEAVPLRDFAARLAAG